MVILTDLLVFGKHDYVYVSNENSKDDGEEKRSHERLFVFRSYKKISTFKLFPL